MSANSGVVSECSFTGCCCLVRERGGREEAGALFFADVALVDARAGAAGGDTSTSMYDCGMSVASGDAMNTSDANMKSEGNTTNVVQRLSRKK